MYTTHLGGYFKHWGMDAQVDMRFGSNYLTDNTTKQDGTIVDFKYVTYLKVSNVDVGPYFAVNSAEFFYDGYVAGMMGRVRAEFGRLGIFVRYQYPMYGYHVNAADRSELNPIRFNTFLRDFHPLRYNEERISIGATFLLKGG